MNKTNNLEPIFVFFVFHEQGKILFIFYDKITLYNSPNDTASL